MAPDPITERFESLGKTFPGRTPPHSQRAEEPPEPKNWDARPRTILWKGDAREFFMIGHLAAALGRSVQTIRAWESSGLLPKSRYRTAPPPHGVNGAKPKGRRLWTRMQIEGLLRIAEQEGVILNDGPPPTRAFTERARKLFTELAKTDN